MSLTTFKLVQKQLKQQQLYGKQLILKQTFDKQPKWVSGDSPVAHYVYKYIYVCLEVVESQIDCAVEVWWI